MTTRRMFLKTAVAAVAGSQFGWETIIQAAERQPLIVRDARSSGCATARTAHRIVPGD